MRTVGIEAMTMAGIMRIERLLKSRAEMINPSPRSEGQASYFPNEGVMKVLLVTIMLCMLLGCGSRQQIQNGSGPSWIMLYEGVKMVGIRKNFEVVRVSTVSLLSQRSCKIKLQRQLVCISGRFDLRI